MTRRIERLSAAEHVEMAAALVRARDALGDALTIACDHLPKSHPALLHLRATERSLTRTRSLLDDILATDHPGDFATTTYYPQAWT